MNESLDKLINGWLDGSLTKESQAELETNLLHDSVTREHFWLSASLHGLFYVLTDTKDDEQLSSHDK